MIAIHTSSGNFATEWVAYCKEHRIAFKSVDCFASDIIGKLQGCDALLWHWHYHDFRAALFARQLVASVEQMGLVVFPSTATAWHYDDKVGQKYLLEAIGAPLVPTHVFYDRETALQWVEQTDFPKVWKLRGGAGSQNVRLIASKYAARRIVKRSFSRGWSNSRLNALRERLWQVRRDKTVRSLIDVGRGLARAIVPHENDLRHCLQRDYVYFQDFAPDNDFDIRVVVIGARAFGIKRVVREGDFRASGSGFIIYERHQIPVSCVQISFEVTSALRAQSCAFDFVFCEEAWRIVEVSYAFSADAYRRCPGYWDTTLSWNASAVEPERFMLEDLLETPHARSVSLE